MKLEIMSEIPRRDYNFPDGSKIVTFDVLGKSADFPMEEFNRNVFRIDSLGNVIWRIAYHDTLHGPDPFVEVRQLADGKILGFTWDGWQFEIGFEDGSLKNLGWSR